LEREKRLPKITDILEKPESLLEPLKIVEELNQAILKIDEQVKKFDSTILNFDEKLMNIPEIPEIERATDEFSAGASYSYQGQTPESYCGECLERHFSKAIGLLEEAERFSLKEGRLTRPAVEKVRRAIQEIVTAEDDIRPQSFKSEAFRKMIDQVAAKMREVRKLSWAKKLTTVGASLEDLREVKREFEKLRDLAYKAATVYIVEEQKDSIKGYLRVMGLPEDKLDQAARIVGEALADIKPIEQAEKELSELTGYEVKIDLSKGVPQLTFRRPEHG